MGVCRALLRSGAPCRRAAGPSRETAAGNFRGREPSGAGGRARLVDEVAQLVPAGDAELRIRPVQVGGDGAGRQVQPVGDLAVGEATAGEDDDLTLLRVSAAVRRRRVDEAAKRGPLGVPADY